MSERAVSRIAEIAASLERYKVIMEGSDGVRLRKVNHVKTIRGTTAIEGNTLTEAQVTAILDGRGADVPINVPINDKVLALVREHPGVNRKRMADILKVDVKTIGRALLELPQIEHRGSKKTGRLLFARHLLGRNLTGEGKLW